MIYENEFIRMELVDDVVYADYKPNVFIDIEEAKNIVEQRNILANQQPHYVLLKGGPITIAPNARSYALNKESAKNIIAWAIVDKMNLFKTAFLKILFFTQGKGHSMRFFGTEDEAMTWLNKKRQEKASPISSPIN
jgi:hypothetical protein